MAIGNKNIAICRDCHPRSPIEGIVPLPPTPSCRASSTPCVLVELESPLSEDDARGIARRHAEYGLFVIDIADPQIAHVVDVPWSLPISRFNIYLIKKLNTHD
jgi:hypothetical protein